VVKDFYFMKLSFFFTEVFALFVAGLIVLTGNGFLQAATPEKAMTKKTVTTTVTTTDVAPKAKLRAADLTLPATGGKSINLRKLGKPMVVVFYPGDNTPGCTVQLCALRDNYKAFKAAGAEVLGVNPASVKSHEEFAAKQKFPFPLLSDKDNKLATSLGVGNMLGFVNRTVFVLDKTGTVVFTEAGMPSPEKLLGVVKGLK
jgi:thioredoxin-dependent peroxiredoxin